MIIAFHCQQLGVRGTEVATYDYAYYSEVLLKNKSIILTPKNSDHNQEAVKKFTQKFTVVYYIDKQDFESKLEQYKVDRLYVLKAGFNDGMYSEKVKTLVHVVFRYYEPHGHAYMYISPWLAQIMTGDATRHLPHMVTLPYHTNDLRKQLGIPFDAIVFGRYGGYNTFDIDFVKHSVYSIASENPNLYFLFMNTQDFVGKHMYHKRWKNKLLTPILFPKKSYKNIIFLNPTSDLHYKRSFVNTCDAMLHARTDGETFGLACGEFSICNKPIITADITLVKDAAHIDILQSKGVYYKNSKELKNILLHFKKEQYPFNDAYSHRFNPEIVMQRFNEIMHSI